MRAFAKLMMGMSLALGLMAGCADEIADESLVGLTDEELAEVGEGAGDESLASDSFAVTNSRADWSGSSATPDSANWGVWSQTLYCAAGSFAQAFDQRVEPKQGSGDDTALNTVRLHCYKPSNSYVERFVTHPGLYGSYGSAPKCSGAGNFITGVRIRLESPQGSGDDTGANDVQFACKNGGSIAANNGLDYGSFSNWDFCPTGTAVCGMQVKVEASQGGGDDTSMNGISMKCCQL